MTRTKPESAEESSLLGRIVTATDLPATVEWLNECGVPCYVRAPGCIALLNPASEALAPCPGRQDEPIHQVWMARFGDGWFAVCGGSKAGDTPAIRHPDSLTRALPRPLARPAATHREIRDIATILTATPVVGRRVTAGAVARLAVAPDRWQRLLAREHAQYPNLPDAVRVESVLLGDG